MTAASSVRKRRRRYSFLRLLGFCVFVLVMAVMILGAGIYYIGRMTPKDVGSQSLPIDLVRSYETPGSVAFNKKSRMNILCLGVDYNYDKMDVHYTKWVRSDTMFVLSVDRAGQILNILAIPRDCRVELVGHGMDKINAAYSLKETGDLETTKATVEKFLGIPMDHTIVIREYAASKLVDVVGGVTINVDKQMDYDDNWGHLHVHLKKGIQRLNGTQAVGYVRFRHDEDGDRGRIKRQQVFMDALLKELRKPENITRYQELAKAFKENIQTDLTMGELLDLAHVYKNFDRKKMMAAKVDGGDENIGGVDYIIPDDVEKKRLVDQLLVERVHSPNESTLVEVLNGSGVQGAAADLAQYLKKQGYTVTRVANAPGPPTPETYMQDHKNNEQLVRTFQHILGQTRTNYAPLQEKGPDITIVLGKDWKDRYKAYQDEPTAIVTPSPSEPSYTPPPIETNTPPPPPPPRHTESRRPTPRDTEPENPQMASPEAPVESAPEEAPTPKEPAEPGNGPTATPDD